jgi:hypothetical protein
MSATRTSDRVLAEVKKSLARHGAIPPEPKPETQKARREREKQEAIDHLRKVLSPGDRVYGIVRTVSRSGMSRTIDFYAFKQTEGRHGVPPWHGVPPFEVASCDRVYLSGWIATALDYPRTKDGALKVGGYGMDMVFSVVYHLSYALFPGGFGIACGKCGYRPKSPDDARRAINSNLCAAIERSGTEAHEFRGRNGDRSGWDKDGGYALKHESL